ncbi:hypothetical protein MBLNU459_g3032t1 [Dothideomycetes sp. NU459]
MRSTVSLEEISDFIDVTFVGDRQPPIPAQEAYHVFLHRLIDIEELKNLVAQANPGRRMSIAKLLVDYPSPGALPPGSAPGYKAVAESVDLKKEIPFRVPAAPWTCLTSDDELVSHLVSLFLVWVNASERLIEEDLFIEGMRSGDVDTIYCSQSLVNAVLALGSLYSEREEVFGAPNDYTTRGQHFHEESERLLRAENDKDTTDAAMVRTTDPIWTASPYLDDHHQLDQNMLSEERNKLTRISWQVPYLTFSKDRSPSDVHVQQEADELAQRLRLWRDNLPPALRYQRSTSAPVFLLHAVYHSFLLTLFNFFQGSTTITTTADSRPSTSPDNFNAAACAGVPHMHAAALSVARDIGSMSRDWCEQYGLKTFLPYHIQAVAIASYTLLPDLSSPAPSCACSSSPPRRRPSRSRPASPPSLPSRPIPPGASRTPA